MQFFELMILPNEVFSNARLQQSTHRAAAANLEWVFFPLTQPSLSVPDSTHYQKYIYDHMTTPHQLSQQAQNFGQGMPDPFPSEKAGSVDETRGEGDWQCNQHLSFDHVWWSIVIVVTCLCS